MQRGISMKYKSLLMILISSFAYSSQSDLNISFENKRKSPYVNGIKCYCDCGKEPVLALILFGRLDLYCEDHIPEIERVRKVTPENLSDVLRRES